MNWGGDHWVGLCIKLTEGHVTVFDSYVPHTEIEEEGIYHNKRGGGIGPCAAKFIEMHAARLNGGNESDYPTKMLTDFESSMQWTAMKNSWAMLK
uniref:Ubiquitin-like protease family profile domain-containing protein n=1 Tax=Brassica oleracea TaxID=3712 RepID=A0A3P6BTG2_BRAOL|nr:unnamed protein product [Brassica oleracea]